MENLERLTKKQLIMFIEYNEKLSNCGTDEYKEINNTYLSNPDYKFLKDYIPSFRKYWEDFKEVSNKTKKTETEHYKEKNEFAKNTSDEYVEKNEIQQEKAEEKKEVEQIKTFATGAFVAGTLVPSFVMVKDNKFIDFSGYRFEKESARDGAVILMKKDIESETTKKILIDTTFYKSIIENSKIIAKAPEVTPEIIKKYEQKAELDHDRLRDNTSSNFWHNYRLMCRHNATNLSDAMKIANEIVSKMPLLEQLHFKRQVNEYNKLTGSKNSYNERLINYYNENVKDLPVTHSIFSKESTQLVPNHYYDVIQKTGEQIDKKLSLKIGSIVNMSFKFDDIATGKTQKLPTKELIIVAASAEKNKVVLVDKDNLSKYTVPRDEFLKQMQKHEKSVQKEKKREMKNTYEYSY
jgi:hypothetical protein